MDDRSTAERVRSGLGEALARRVGIDVRALAAFRVTLGVLLVADLALRSRNLVAFYTDRGALPRSALRAAAPALSRLSLHAVSGEAWVQALLFALAAVVALALLVGYRTRAATLLSLLLLLSLHFRNPYVLNGGDGVFRRLLVWSVFLPLGGRLSVDALRRRRRAGGPGSDDRADDDSAGDRVANLATAGLLLQVIVVYASNAVLKSRGALWTSGDAIAYVFSLRQLTVLLGDRLAADPVPLRPLGELWFVMLVASPLLILLTGRPRALLVGLFAAMHAGMALFLKLGIFPAVSVVALVPFLPPAVWDAAERRDTGPFRDRASGTGLDPSRWRDRIDWIVPPTGLPGVPRSVVAWLGGWRRWLGRPLLACMLAFVLLWNAAALGFVGPPAAVTEFRDPTENRWSMFAPEPPRVDGWFVAPAQLESGGRADAWNGGPVRWDPPPDVSATYPTARWRKYLENVRREDAPLGRPFAAYLCRRWNAAHPTDATAVRVVYVEQSTRLSGPEPTRRVELARRSCDAAGTTRRLPGATVETGVGGDGVPIFLNLKYDT
jgi:hypothetical protein